MNKISLTIRVSLQILIKIKCRPQVKDSLELKPVIYKQEN